MKGLLVKRAAVWILAALSLVSCSDNKRPYNGADVVSKQTVQSFLFSRQIHPDLTFAPDPAYYIPTVDWVLHELSPALKEEQKRRGLDRYEDPANNCNKFTRTAAEFAGAMFFHSPGRPAGCSLAFGEFWYANASTTKGHALNCVIVRRASGELDLVFYEPQTRSFVLLSHDQETNCIVRF